MAKSMDKIIGADLVNKPDGRKFHGPDKYKQMAEWTFDHNPRVAARIQASLASKSSAPVSYAQAKASFANHFENRVKTVNAWAQKLGTKPESVGEVLKQSIRGQGYLGEVRKRNWMSGFESGLGKSKHITVGGKLAGREKHDSTYTDFKDATGWTGSKEDYDNLTWDAATKTFTYEGTKWVSVGTKGRRRRVPATWIFSFSGVSPVVASYKEK